MASWVTHLMVADGVLQRFPFLDRRGFCVGSIAPDCNVENADWTAFTPPREVTHWMQGDKKEASDCERFREKMITERSSQIRSGEEYSGSMPERKKISSITCSKVSTFEEYRERSKSRLRFE